MPPNFKNIVLITNGFPFGATNETFLENEICYLAKYVNNISIISKINNEKIKKTQRNVPNNCSVHALNTKSTPIQKIKLLFTIIRRITLFASLFRIEVIASKKKQIMASRQYSSYVS